jgi:hypothetical protein
VLGSVVAIVENHNQAMLFIAVKDINEVNRSLTGLGSHRTP